MTTSSGVRALAAAAAAAEELEAAAAGRQLELMPELKKRNGRAREEELELEPPSRLEPGTLEHQAMLAKVKRARGRPPGARNLASERRVNLIMRMCGDPLYDSMRLAMHTPETLALELGCSKLEAARLLEEVRRDLRTYCYPRRAPTDGDGNVVAPFFAVQIGSSQGGADAPPPWVYPGGPEVSASEQNQGVSGEAAEVSPGQVSPGNGK